MSKIIRSHLPCIACDSTDAMNIHENGTAYCWSCGKSFPKSKVDAEMSEEPVRKPASQIRVNKGGNNNNYFNIPSASEVEDYPIKGIRDREISTATCEFFGVRTSYNSDGVAQARYYPYSGGGYKIRLLPKEFMNTQGFGKGVFGIDKFQPGGKRLVITTGDDDVLSVAEAMSDRYKGTIYPVITAGADTKVDELLEYRDFIRSFDEVVLAFDMDAAGKKAVEKAIRIVGIDKVKICKLSAKDPNAVLLKSGSEQLMKEIFEAAPYIPGGILGRDDLWEKLEEYNDVESMPFPPCMEGINEKTKGKRYGDITLFISGTGAGKSTLIREDMLFTLEQTDDKIGVLAFEEGPGESTRKLSAMALNKNPADNPMTLEELKPGFDIVFGSNRVMVLDHQGSMTSDDSIIEKIEYMILKGCRHIYIDHITLLVSEGVEGLQGNEAQDKIMGELLRLVKRYPVWIGLVSHLRKVQAGSRPFEEGKLPSMDDIRGSGSVKQISMDIIAFSRNMKSSSEAIRNHIKIEVLKCRFSGLTGPVHGADYDYPTGRLTLSNEEFVEVDEHSGDDE